MDVSDNQFYPNLPSININSLQSSLQISPLSPDEMVIRSRGRRRIPSSFSPERIATGTPPSSTSNPRKRNLNCIFQSSPRSRFPPKFGKADLNRVRILSGSTEEVRKHLDFSPGTLHQNFNILKLVPMISKGYSEYSQSHPSETDLCASPMFKKLRRSLSLNNHVTTTISSVSSPNPLQLAKGLSKSQLLDSIVSLVTSCPSLAARLPKLLPKPDLTSLVTDLAKLNRNIYKALPKTRLSDSRDSLPFNCVAIHLMAFKRHLVENLNMLLDAGQWDSVLDFVIQTWDIVKATPLWTNPVHNALRNSCFKHMASSVITVMKLKNCSLGEKKVNLVKLMTESSIREVQLCREQLLQLVE